MREAGKGDAGRKSILKVRKSRTFGTFLGIVPPDDSSFAFSGVEEIRMNKEFSSDPHDNHSIVIWDWYVTIPLMMNVAGHRRGAPVAYQ